ncbi:MAG: ABC transporter permease, partial [Gemmatimonadaceae bacterium]
MGIVAGVRHWLRTLFTRNRVESEMNREMRFHVDMETERLVSGGVPPDEARRRAMARFGGVERYKEEVRAERGTGWLDAAVIEFRIAWRGLAKRPAFAIVVIVTIAIGVGATTAVYSWANWALFRPVPGVRDPGRMVSVEFLTSPNERGSYSETGISYANFGDLKATVHSFSGLAGYAQQTAQLAVPNADPMELWGALVLGDYFGTLGVVPRLGRAFSPTELVPSASDRVVIISDSIWHLAFGGARDVLGREVRVNGEAFTVIGVAPPGFRGSERSGRDDLWFPGAAYTALAHQHTDLSDRGVG